MKKPTAKKVCEEFIAAVIEKQPKMLNSTEVTKMYPNEPDYYASMNAVDETTINIATQACVLTNVRWDLYAKDDRIQFTFTIV